MLRRYVVVSEIYVNGLPVGAHLHSSHFFQFQAERMLTGIENYQGEFMTMRYAIWPISEWKLGPNCRNTKFQCFECEETCEMNYV
jgi:hypothetical protein